MTRYRKRDCASCGHLYVGDPEDSDTLPAMCPPCDAAAKREDKTFRCDVCGTRRPTAALAEVHHDDTNTYICASCDHSEVSYRVDYFAERVTNKPHTERMDNRGGWHDAITFAAQYGKNDAESEMLNSFSRRELEHLALRLSALVHMRGEYLNSIQGNHEWLYALRNQYSNWFD